MSRGERGQFASDMARRHSRRGGPGLEHMRMRMELLRLVRERAEQECISFYSLARMCRTSEPRAWHILRGRNPALFNSETLIDILSRLGVTVEVVVTSRTVRIPSWNRPL